MENVKKSFHFTPLQFCTAIRSRGVREYLEGGVSVMAIFHQLGSSLEGSLVGRLTHCVIMAVAQLTTTGQSHSCAQSSFRAAASF